MKGSSFAPVDSIDNERTTWNPAKERWQEQQRLVGIVIAAYRSVKDLPAIGAFNLDEQSRSAKWTPDSCHYAIDVENCIRHVIEFKREDERPALWAAWSNLLTDDAKIGPTEQRLIRLLAPAFFRKELHPAIYFRPCRHPSRRPH